MSVNRNVLIFDDKKIDTTHPWKRPFLACIIGSIGQGKTSFYLNILHELDGHFNKIVVFSGNKTDPQIDAIV